METAIMQVSHTNQQQAFDQINERAHESPPPGPARVSGTRAKGTPGTSPRPEVPTLPSRESQPAKTPGLARTRRSSDTTAGSSAALILAPAPESTIYGVDGASAPGAGDSLQQREQHVADYAGRVKAQLANIESGSEAERNVKYLSARPFTTPSGYFSGGLLAAGFDSNADIKATLTRGTKAPLGGLGSSRWKVEGRDGRPYKAWQVAAGALDHDRPAPGGLTWQTIHLAPADEARVKELQAVGAKLQDSWKQDVAAPLGDASGPLAARSGKADAYATRATLQSLKSDTSAFQKLSAEGQKAVDRTLNGPGQAIIPNVYGYPLAGYAFVPYTPYDGNYEHRPNQGLMVDINRGGVSEIHGDGDFAKYAQRNRDALLHGFNAADAQGGLDAHWPPAGQVLDELIAGKTTHYGYKNLVSDQRIPVRELFNYTRARGGDYQLKYGNLTPGAGDRSGGIASQYQAVNASNAKWADQTQVFDKSDQDWKSAKEFWDNSFGYVPGVGNVGNIVFGAHDSLHGQTAQERRGGNVAATLSGLQLAHDVAPGAVEATLGAPPSLSKPASGGSHWNYNPSTSDFRFKPPTRLEDGRIGYLAGPKRAPKLPGADDSPPSPKRPRTDDPPPPLADSDSSPFREIGDIEPAELREIELGHFPAQTSSQADSSPSSGRESPDRFSDIEDFGPTELHDITFDRLQPQTSSQTNPGSPQPGPSGTQRQPAQTSSLASPGSPQEGPVLRPPLRNYTEADNALYRPASDQYGATSQAMRNVDGTQAGCLGLGMLVTRLAAWRPDKLNLLSAARLAHQEYQRGGARKANILAKINRIQSLEMHHTDSGRSREIPGYNLQEGYLADSRDQLIESMRLGFNPETGGHPRFAMLHYEFREGFFQRAGIGHVGFVERLFDNGDYRNDRYAYYDSSEGAFLYSNFEQLGRAIGDYYGAAYRRAGGFGDTRTYFYTITNAERERLAKLS